MEAADNRGFRNLRVIDKRALDFHRADAMARYVDDVVDAPEYPEVAVFVALRAVAREICRAIPFAPVLLYESLGISVDAAQHSWPWSRQREKPSANVDHITGLSANLRLDARKRNRRGARFKRRQTRQRR